MRTLTDLNSALEALERRADAYEAAKHEPSAVGFDDSADEILLLAPAAHRRRVRPVLWLTAAAAAIAVAATSLALVQTGSSSRPSGGRLCRLLLRSQRPNSCCPLR